MHLASADTPRRARCYRCAIRAAGTHGLRIVAAAAPGGARLVGWGPIRSSRGACPLTLVLLRAETRVASSARRREKNRARARARRTESAAHWSRAAELAQSIQTPIAAPSRAGEASGARTLGRCRRRRRPRLKPKGYRQRQERRASKNMNSRPRPYSGRRRFRRACFPLQQGRVSDAEARSGRDRPGPGARTGAPDARRNADRAAPPREARKLLHEA